MIKVEIENTRDDVEIEYGIMRRGDTCKIISKRYIL
jgi:hypothetical protein